MNADQIAYQLHRIDPLREPYGLPLQEVYGYSARNYFQAILITAAII